jgi:hypothetical protein
MHALQDEPRQVEDDSSDAVNFLAEVDGGVDP